MFSKREPKNPRQKIDLLISYYNMILIIITQMIHIKKSVDSIYLGEPPTTDSKYYGKIYYNDGTSYQGYFLNGLKHGQGHEHSNNGYSKGYYRDDKLNGEVMTFDKNKGYIVGYYQDGLLNGDCITYDTKCLVSNKGMYKNGKSCVSTYETIFSMIDTIKKKIYEGFMFNDKYNGFGKLYENGMVFIGNMTTGKKDGRFLVCYPNGSLAYSPQTNLEVIIDIDKVNKDNFSTYKNTILFTNGVYDDDHKIVHKENNTIKYIGKLNSNMNYHDENGCLYQNNNTYTGKFDDGKFVGGVYNFVNGKYKGDLENLKMYGEAYVELIDGSNFHGIFNNGKSDVGIYRFKLNNVYTSIKAVLDLSDEKNIRIYVNPNTELIVSNNKYTGDFKFNITGNYENFNIRFILNNGKHYIDNILNYEGDFKNFKQHGQGMRYYPTGSVHMIGKFNEGEISKCEYYDESGNLIYSDFTES